MNRTLTCIICPRGCTLEATIDGEAVTVKGHACPRGEQYAANECTNPVRTVTSTVRVSNRPDTMVSVKTVQPIPKGKMADVMARIRATAVEAPVQIGDSILEDVYGTSVVATGVVR